MIIVDENMDDDWVIDAIVSWYAGQVTSITALRPNSVIKDEAIPTLLLRAHEPTFVTLNVFDFWKRVAVHQGYGIITLNWQQPRVFDALPFLRRCLRLPAFRTKAARMGKIVRLTPTRIEYYESDKRIQSFTWPS